MVVAMLAACGQHIEDAEPPETTAEPAFTVRAADEVTEQQLTDAAAVLQRRLVAAGLADAAVRVDPGSGVVSIDVAEGDEDVVLDQIRPRPVRLRPVVGCTETESLRSTATSVSTSGAEQELLPLKGGSSCLVGAAAADGTIFEPDAEAQVLAGEWGVLVSLRPGADGTDRWNAVARICFDGASECPSRQIAIEVDGIIVSAPTMNVPVFEGSVLISGEFTEQEARELADVLIAGALDVEWVVES